MRPCKMLSILLSILFSTLIKNVCLILLKVVFLFMKNCQFFLLRYLVTYLEDNMLSFKNWTTFFYFWNKAYLVIKKPIYALDEELVSWLPYAVCEFCLLVLHCGLLWDLLGRMGKAAQISDRMAEFLKQSSPTTVFTDSMQHRCSMVQNNGFTIRMTWWVLKHTS